MPPLSSPDPQPQSSRSEALAPIEPQRDAKSDSNGSSNLGGSSNPGQPDPGPSSWWHQHRENIITIVLAVLLTVGIRTFVAEARWIPSNSMLPTLEVGDRLIVEKISYYFRDPRRGDIIVFDPPERLNFEGAYIKRVVGLPGDRIRIADGTVAINDVVIEENYIFEPPFYSCPGTCPGVSAQGSDFVVPENQYLVLGDNRNDSQDSHYWGFLEKDNIIGHTILRFWPLNRLHYFGAQTYDELPS